MRNSSTLYRNSGRRGFGVPRRTPHRVGLQRALGVQRQNGDSTGRRLGGVQEACVPAIGHSRMIKLDLDFLLYLLDFPHFFLLFKFKDSYVFVNAHPFILFVKER